MTVETEALFDIKLLKQEGFIPRLTRSKSVVNNEVWSRWKEKVVTATKKAIRAYPCAPGERILSLCVTAPSADCCHNTCVLPSKHSMYVHIQSIACTLNFCPA